MITCPSCGVGVPSGSRFCPSCGVALADAGLPEEMLKLVSVRVADAVGSTARADRMHPDTRTLMAHYFAAVATEIEAEGGTIEKVGGDAAEVTIAS